MSKQEKPDLVVIGQNLVFCKTMFWKYNFPWPHKIKAEFC